MRTKHVIVLPFDSNWKSEFDKIKSELVQVLGDTAIAVEHVGSTAVEGLAAKPIIDIDVVVEGDDVQKAIDKLATIGYIHEGNLGIEGREAFTYEGKEHLMTHHLYVCPKDSIELKRHLAFRDYLRSHREASVAYSNVKMEAAKLFPEDIEKYIDHKSPVIEEIYREISDGKFIDTEK